MPDKTHIDDLNKRYWAAETSLEEENVLRDMASPEDSTAILNYFAKQREIRLEDDIPLPYTKEQPAKIIPLRRRLTYIAAVAVVLIGLLFFLRPTATQADGEIASAEEAYEELTQALYFISNKMNSGLITADASLQKVQPIKDIFK